MYLWGEKNRKSDVGSILKNRKQIQVPTNLAGQIAKIAPKMKSLWLKIHLWGTWPFRQLLTCSPNENALPVNRSNTIFSLNLWLWSCFCTSVPLESLAHSLSLEHKASETGIEKNQLATSAANNYNYSYYWCYHFELVSLPQSAESVKRSMEHLTKRKP